MKEKGWFSKTEGTKAKEAAVNEAAFCFRDFLKENSVRGRFNQEEGQRENAHIFLYLLCQGVHKSHRKILGKKSDSASCTAAHQRISLTCIDKKIDVFLIF